ncbi:hypothetical protein [Oceanisphaera sp. W20_SRM_FM3]|uniref:hypothetical protein n=1 Tax=Oceanisphaera sp. W20_SRM_FM3 TaxID=3240267 RepID=UPI003F981719
MVFLDRHYEFFIKYNVRLIFCNNDNTSITELNKDYAQLIIKIINNNKNHGYFGSAREALIYLKNIEYNYVILSNVDLCLDESYFKGLADNISDEPLILAPSIISNLTRRQQNPLYREKPRKIKMRFLYFLLLNRYFYAFYKALSSVFSRESTKQSDLRIYAVHGANVIVNYKAIQRGIDFSHCGFLFGEEISLAERVAELDVEVKFIKTMKVVHYEHDSTGNYLRSKLITCYHRRSIGNIIRKFF